MQKIILFIVVLASFVSCDVDKLEPAQTKAFMKFFGDVGNTEGVDLLKLEDGYLLLGNNFNGNLTTTVLIKTDLNGNQIWSTPFKSISGSSLAKSSNSYFIVGDGIDSDTTQQATKLSLIKTNLDGDIQEITSLGEPNTHFHGTGVTVNSGEVVVCGYTNEPNSGPDSTFLYGYDATLTPSWDDVRKWKGGTSSKTLLYEDIDSTFIWTSLYIIDNKNKIEGIKVSRDNPTALVFDVLKDEDFLTGDLGDLGMDSGGGKIIVQTAKNANNKNTIEVGTYYAITGDPKQTFSIGSSDNNYSVGSVIQATDGSIIIIGSTDERVNKNEDDIEKNKNRSDVDFYLTKVDDNGSVSSVNGFTAIIGGTGNEEGVAIVQANDRGFVFLGTMLNTNGVKMMVLVKVDVRGELIN